MLRWLSSFPGGTWQHGWEASRAEDHPGSSWVQLPLRWLQDNGMRASSDDNDLSSGLLMLICGDAIRPGLAWMLTRTHRYLALVMAGTRDPAGFDRLRELAEAGQASSLDDARYAATRVATLMACKGGLVSDITVGDCVELADTQRRVHARGGQRKVDFYLRLRSLGIFPADAPATIRAFGMAQGQLTVGELVDRYRLQCKPVRDLLVDYLKERQPALDYASLDSVSRSLAGLFWARIEALSPGITTLQLPPDVARAWKEDLLVYQAERHRPRREEDRRHPAADQRQGRADTRPGALSRHLPVGHGRTGTLGAVGGPEPGQRRRDQLGQGTQAPQGQDGPADPRAAARPARPHPHRRRAQERGGPPAAGRHRDTARPGHRGHRRNTRRTVAPKATGRHVWAEDTATGKRRNLSYEEEEAFWAFAAIEVLRLTGIRCEELLELTHHGITEYRLPTTGELVPLLQIAPSKTDTERLLLVSPELADVLSAIISRLRGPGGDVPLTVSYDVRERVWNPADAAAVPAVHRQREPGVHPQRGPQAAHQRARRDRPDRRRRRPAHVLPARFPKNLRDRRHHERPAAPYRPGHLRAQEHRHHDRLQGRLPGRGDRGPPGVHRPPPRNPAQRGIPYSHRRRMGRLPRPLRKAESLGRHVRPRIRVTLRP